MARVAKILLRSPIHRIMFKEKHPKHSRHRRPTELKARASMRRYRDLYHKTHAKLKETEEAHKRLATAIDQAVDSIVITDPQGIIQYVNPAFEKSSGYTRNQAIGLTPAILKSGHHTESFYEDLWQTITSDKVWRGSLINKNKSGEQFTEKATISPVKDTEGNIINFVAVKHDISRELELEQQLQQAVKMEAMGTLAGGIAHDFNNILAAILGYTKMAMDDLSPESRPYQDLSQVLQSGDRAVALVKQILLFSRQEKQGLIPISLQPLIKETLKMLRASLPASIKLKEKISAHCPPIMADPTQIQQILINLCSNAKQAMQHSGGTLAISLSRVERTEDDGDDDSMVPETFLQLMVTDSGAGISKECLSHIFDPFFTTKSLEEGTGLGLAVVHGLVQSHGGSIEVNSTRGEGTSFRILFPATSAVSSSTTDDTEKSLPRGKEHILVVDDEENILSIRKRLLSKLGYHVTTFLNGREALESFSKAPEQYDLLLSDMTMPNMDGRELLVKIREIRPTIPAILCTGHSELIDREKAEECGFQAFLEKPIPPISLANTLHELLHDQKHDAA
jgi:PAS domain S-box-containing protein